MIFELKARSFAVFFSSSVVVGSGKSAREAKAQEKEATIKQVSASEFEIRPVVQTPHVFLEI